MNDIVTKAAERQLMDDFLHANKLFYAPDPVIMQMPSTPAVWAAK